MTFRKELWSDISFSWAAVSFLKSYKMLAIWKKNTLASLNAQMSDEERHSAHEMSRPVARGNNTKSSCLWGIFAVCSRPNNPSVTDLSWLHGD